MLLMKGSMNWTFSLAFLAFVLHATTIEVDGFRGVREKVGETALYVLESYVERMRDPQHPWYVQRPVPDLRADDKLSSRSYLETNEKGRNRAEKQEFFFGKKKEDANSQDAVIKEQLAKGGVKGEASKEELEQLAKAVAASEKKLIDATSDHVKLQERLVEMQTQSGVFAAPQTNTWHGKVFSYTPEKDSWLTLPFWNGHACAVGVYIGPGGHCHRTLGATLTGCSGKPDKKILASTGQYKSSSCQCDMCNGFSGSMMAAPYCHTNGLNRCHCMLVDNAIDNEKNCENLE